MPDKITHIGDLTPDAGNARAHTERGLGMLEKSLQEVGAARSIVIDEDGRILAGNATVEAAGHVGIENVKVVQANGNEIIAVQRTGLTDKQKTRLALLDNRVGELSDWDSDVLADLDASGDLLDDLFSSEELDALFDTEGGGEGGDSAEGQYRISPEQFERHDYVVIICDNEFDWQVLCDRLRIEQVACGKVGNKTVTQKGLSRVIEASAFLAMLDD